MRLQEVRYLFGNQYLHAWKKLTSVTIWAKETHSVELSFSNKTKLIVRDFCNNALIAVRVVGIF